MSRIQQSPKKIYIWVNEWPAPADEEYYFPASDLSWGTYPWWTLRTGAFAQGSLGSDWTTVSRSNTACVMYRSISWNFKIQHREAYYNAEWGWRSSCWVSTATNWTNMARPWEWNTHFDYWSTVAWGYNQWSWIYINGVKELTTSQLVSGTIFIDEIIYENGVYTVSLYEDNNGEPGTQLYTYTASSEAVPAVLRVYHEVWTGTASQTNRVKKRSL